MKILDGTFLFLRAHCSADLLSIGLESEPIETSDIDLWDITDYINTDIDGVSIIDKCNIIMCFLYRGRIIYNGTVFVWDQRQLLLDTLVNATIITPTQKEDILFPWIGLDIPYFIIQ